MFNFKGVEAELLAIESEANYKGHGILRLFKCLLLQFMEDLSDRELECYLADSNAGKWFCDFALTEKTPDHGVEVCERVCYSKKKMPRSYKVTLPILLNSTMPWYISLIRKTQLN